MELSEKKLILESQNGNMTAFEELVSKYDRKVLALALRYVKNNDDAKDIYQEVFLRVFKGIKSFRFKSEFSTWLFRITTNVCLSYKDKQKRQRALSIDENYGSDDDEESGMKLQISAAEPSPEDDAKNSEIIDRVSDAVNELSPQQKMVFTMKHYDGYKIREIADIMNCTEGTIKKYLFTAVRKLRDSLGDLYQS